MPRNPSYTEGSPNRCHCEPVGLNGVAISQGNAPKPPLCKGRWHGVSRDGGIVNPPVFLLRKNPAPFTQGGQDAASPQDPSTPLRSAQDDKGVVDVQDASVEFLSLRGRRPWQSPAGWYDTLLRILILHREIATVAPLPRNDRLFPRPKGRGFSMPSPLGRVVPKEPGEVTSSDLADARPPSPKGKARLCYQTLS